MDLRLSEEQAMIKDMTRKFANDVVAPQVKAIEGSENTPMK